jgi:hypothetical protein
MNCQECERKLGMGEDAAEHLASCSECRGLAEELRLNAVALREMRVRPRVRWEWALAAAAAVVMAIATWKVTRVDKIPTQPMPVAVAAAKPLEALHGPAPRKRAKRHLVPAAEPLRVKMLTSDPDVVIYWIVDRKEGFE